MNESEFVWWRKQHRADGPAADGVIGALQARAAAGIPLFPLTIKVYPPDGRCMVCAEIGCTECESPPPPRRVPHNGYRVKPRIAPRHRSREHWKYGGSVNWNKENTTPYLGGLVP